jgi:membrane associated rhomboid family serine protease
MEPMTSEPEMPPAVPSPRVGEALARLQQVLLMKRGYAFIAGNSAAWPFTDVVMDARGSMLLVAPWTPERAAALEEGWRGFAQRSDTGVGLLLVGEVSPSAVPYRAYLQAGHGVVGYVSALTGESHVERSLMLWTSSPSGVLQPRQLAAVIADAWALPGVDHEALRTQLLERQGARREQYAFQAAVQQASEAPVPTETWVLAGSIVVIYVLMALQALSQGRNPINFDLEQLVRWGGLYGEAIRHGEYWRLFTCAGLHGGLIHVAMNTYALIAFGPVIEQWQGRARFLTIVVFSALTASLASVLINPHVIMIGASGWLFGLLGALLATLIRHGRTLPAEMRKGLVSNLLTLLIINGVISMMPGISWAGHAGGLLGGMALGFIITRPPAQRRRLLPMEWALAGALLAATAVGAWWIIGHIPPFAGP